MKTFTSKPHAEPVVFTVDSDEFTALSSTEMPGGVLDAYFKKVKEGEIFEAHYELFRFALDEKSFKLFEDRFNSKTGNPITVSMLAEIATWLLGTVYMGEDDSNAEPSTTTGQKKGRRATSSVEK